MGVRVKSEWFGISALLFAAVLTAAVFSGCGKSPDSLYREGKALVGKPETQAQGLETLEKFVKKFPKDSRAPEVMLAIATIHQSEKRFPQAEAAFGKLMEKYPKSAEACKGMFLLGYMYYDDMKDMEKAKGILNKFIAAYPDSELTVSAKVLLENAGLPVEQWSTVKNIMTGQDTTGTEK